MMTKQKSLIIPFKKFFWYVLLTTGAYLLFYFYRVWTHFKNNPLEEFPKDNQHIQPIGYSLFYIFFLGGLMKRIHSAEKQYCSKQTTSLNILQNNAIFVVIIILIPAILLVMLPTWRLDNEINLIGINMSENLIQAIKTALENVTGEDDLAITAETSAADVDGWDSLANVRLFIELEGELGLRFNASEIENLKNVGDIAQLISSKQEG